MRIDWLAQVLRDAGLTVVEVSGWERLGSAMWNPTGGIVHATADGAARNPVADAADDAAAINVIRNGRADLHGPIANAYQARDGRWHVIAAGRCNTALTGTAGPLRGLGNYHLLGVEHENDNRDEPWPAVQYRSAVRGWAAICTRMGWTPARLAGHKEHDPRRKTDPQGVDMDRFRADVAAVMAGEDEPMTPADVWAVKVKQTAAAAQRFGGKEGDERYAASLLQLAGIFGKDAADGITAARADLAAVKLQNAAVLKAVQGVDDEAILARVDALADQLAQLPAAVRQALLDPSTGPADTATALRTVLGADRAAAVGRLLAAPPA